MKYPATLLALVVAIMIWSFINPYDRLTWWLESIPALVALSVLVLTYPRFRLTNFLYTLIAIHCVILVVGGHYTYAEMPVFNWIRDRFGFARNEYDRLGHFFQGFVPVLIGRELVIRTTALKSGKWLFTLLLFSALGISALYEIIEFIAGTTLQQGADSFLGTQGDVWDTQKDMLMAGIGALTALVFFSRYHDRKLTEI